MFESEAKKSRMHCWKRLRSIKIKNELQRVMNVDSRFREMQKSTIKIVMTRQSSVMIVMIIEEEKSLLFMLSTWCSQSDISIVVMLLIALRQNMKQRCESMSITCVERNSRWSLDAIKIVLVTSKFAVSDEFQTFINWLQVMQILNRIVIDECHVMLNEQRNFRWQMQQLRNLMNVKMQMILLTTTLSLSKEKELWSRMSFKKTKMTLFRVRTIRKNVKYQVMKVKSDDQEKKEKFIVQMIQRVMRDYVEEKIVMYCNSVRKMKKLTKTLNCESYYHHVKQKDEKLKRFQDDEKKVIVTTSALRLRIDILDIRVIIHVDELRSLMNYAQKSERARRDELSSQMIVRWKKDDWEVKSAKEWRIEEMKWVIRFIKNDENDTKASYWRVMMNKYLNEQKNRRECKKRKEKYDVCNKMMRLNEKKIVKNAIQKKKRKLLMQNERELNLMKRQKYDS